MQTEQSEKIGQLADEIENILHATMLPMPVKFHFDQLVQRLPEWRDKLRAIYVAETGENPWAS